MGGNGVYITFSILPYQKTGFIVFRPTFPASYFLRVGRNKQLQNHKQKVG